MNRKYATSLSLRRAMEWLRGGSHESLIEDIHESSLAGQSWSFCLCVCLFFVLYNSHQSVSLEMDIRTSCVTGCPSAPPNNFSFCRSLRPPLFPVTWETKVGHVHWDVRWERGETGRLIGDISPQGTLSAFWRKKWLTVSVCSLGRRGHPEVSEWRGPEWQKTCQNADNKQGRANCVTIKTIQGAKGLLRWY